MITLTIHKVSFLSPRLQGVLSASYRALDIFKVSCWLRHTLVVHQALSRTWRILVWHLSRTESTGSNFVQHIENQEARVPNSHKYMPESSHNTTLTRASNAAAGQTAPMIPIACRNDDAARHGCPVALFASRACSAVCIPWLFGPYFSSPK